MKWRVFYVLLLICVALSCSTERQSDNNNFPVLKGPYLGQTPPGDTPEVFAPGIVCTENMEFMYGFYKAGALFFFVRTSPDSGIEWTDIPVQRTEIKNGKWTKPKEAEITGRPWIYEYPDAPEGTIIIFAWRRNLDGSGPRGDIDLWKSVKKPEGWTPPERLSSPVNTEKFDSWPSIAENGNLYFFSTREGGVGRADLYRSILQDGEYKEVENLGSDINSEVFDHDPFIAPDESYLMWCSNRSGGYGGDDLYIAYKKEDGGWSRPFNLGEKINTPANETRPYVTADGKYLFFVSDANNNTDIYWVDAGILEKLKSDSPPLKGPYLGQTPPGMTPEMFAPGIVSTGAWEYGTAFSPDGKEFYYAVSGAPYDVIVGMKEVDGVWTFPEVVSFSGRYSEHDMNFSPDGNRLFFNSRRPLTGQGEPREDEDLWFVTRTDDGWSKPQNLGSPVNTPGDECYAFITSDGTMYFHRYEKDGKPDADIFMAKSIDGRFQEPERLGPEINSQYDEWDPYIAPDESYIIFSSVRRPGGVGVVDMYISFRIDDGSWTHAKNMGEGLNSKGSENCAMVTPDGKYLFFLSTRRTHPPFSETPITFEQKISILNGPGNGLADIYWVDARVIEFFRPKANR